MFIQEMNKWDWWEYKERFKQEDNSPITTNGESLWNVWRNECCIISRGNKEVQIIKMPRKEICGKGIWKGQRGIEKQKTS